MGYALWNSMILCVTFVTCLLSFHDVALTVPPFPSHSMKYSRHFLLKWLSRIFATSYSSSEWISIKGGGVGIWPLIFDSVAGSNIDTWNMGWICRKASGKPNWKACEEILDVIGYGPKRQWLSFFDGCFVRMFQESSQTLSPTLKSGDATWWLDVAALYWAIVCLMWSLRNCCNSWRSIVWR